MTSGVRRIAFVSMVTVIALALAVTLSMIALGDRTAEGTGSTGTPSMGFIKFEGIDGEAQDKDHNGWSDLVSFDQVIHTPGTSTDLTRRRGDVTLEDILVTKELDKSSPKLAEAICKGSVFPKIEIHMTASYTDGGRLTYYAYELKNVMITSYTVGGATATDEVPMESFSLNFEEIRVTYTETDSSGKSKGNIEYSWKVEEAES